LKNIYTFFSFKTFIVFLLLLFFSSYFFIDTTPGVDQIRHISWVKSLTKSTYLIDLNNIIKNGKLVVDQNSFLINLVRPGYNDIGHLFNTFPIILIYLLSFFKIDLINIFNCTSIFFFCLNTILAINIFNIFFQKNLDLKINLLLFLFLIPSYYFFYAPLGIHNISLFFNLLLLIYLKNYNDLNENKKIAYLIIISTLGIYSHKINIVLLPSIITFFYIFNQKFLSLTKYFFGQILMLMPIILILVFFPETLFATKKFASLDFSINEYISNFYLWFKNTYLTLGPFVLFLFCIGIFFSLKNKKKIKILYLALFFHIFFYIFINSFPVYFLRTNFYINYVILIISFYGIVEIFKKENFLLKLFISIIVILHLTFNLNQFIKFNNDIENHLYKNYFRNKGKIKTTFDEIEKLLINKDVIVYLDDKVKDYFKIYKNQIYEEKSVMIEPIKNYISRDNYYNKKDKVLLFDKSKRIILFSIIADSSSKIKNQEINNVILKLNNFYENENLECNFKLKLINNFDNVGTGNEAIMINQLICD